MQTDPRLQVLNNPRPPKAGLTRREMAQRILGAAAAGCAFPELAPSHPVHKHLADAPLLDQAEAQTAAADWTPQVLDRHQDATLTVLAERLVPRSTEAQVNRFIDLLLSVDTPENQKRFFAALSAFDAEALSRFQKPFKELSAEEQTSILDAASTAEPGQSASSNSYWFAIPSQAPAAPPRLTLRDHFDHLKGWISGAYYSSEVGMRELGWTGNYFFESFPGCDHPDGHR
jgi:hypothetical protein